MIRTKIERQRAAAIATLRKKVKKMKVARQHSLEPWNGAVQFNASVHQIEHTINRLKAGADPSMIIYEKLRKE